MAHRKFVDFPIDSMVIFHCYVNVYQRVTELATDLEVTGITGGPAE